MTELHRRLAALLGLIALGAFVSGAGLDAPSVIPAGLVLLAAVFVQPGERAARILEPVWRLLAALLAIRATLLVMDGTGDLVLPMVDLLLLLLCAESLRRRDGSADARHFALTFALLIAAAAYRPGALFGLLFVAYVACGTLTLVVGHIGRESRARGREAPAPGAGFIARTALLSLLVLVVSGAVFLFFPRVSRGFAARVSAPMRSAAIGFSDRVSIGEHGARLEPNPEPVLRIEFPRGVPDDVTGLYWRGRGYDTFDGIAWSRSGVPAPFTPRRSISGDTIEQMVYAVPLRGSNVVFGLHPVLQVEPETRIRPFRTGGGDYIYIGDVDPAYRVFSGSSLPGADRLRAAPSPDERAGAPGEGLTHLLQVPALTPRTVALADSFAAAHPNPYDRAVAMQRWFRDTFSYTLDLPATREQASLDYFLFERRAGHCEYFSTAMAVLLRAGGVPTRNVNGFLGGEWNDFGGFLTVTQNNAHSWVEVYFPGEGWIRFDPTPGGGAAGAAGLTGTGFTRLQHMIAGLEHRWGKWVLDYDLDTQTSLFQRATEPLARGTTPEDRGSAVPWLIAGAVLAVVLLMRQWAGGHRRGHRPESVAFVRLRSGYEKAGVVPSVSLPPVAFADAVRDAPGGTHARRAVDLYLASRFGGTPVTRDSLRSMKQLAAAALRELQDSRSRRATVG